MTTPNENPHYLSDDDADVVKNYDYLRQDHGGMVTKHNGVADRLLSKNDRLYNELKGDWTRTAWSGNKNIKTTTGRDGGKFYIQREQMNVDFIAQQAQEYRKKAEAGYADPLAPVMPDGSLGYKWMDLPTVVSIDISNKYFGGMPWSVIKHDRTLKAQFYKVVEREYNQFVTYPGGRLPIPVDVPYPTAQGATKFFKGI
jgi:hypothetical protein